MNVILLVAAAIHMPLLVMQLPLKSYDTNFHIFFASHYASHWFDPWNPKWFAGFSQTTYPALPQQWTAILSWLVGLNMAYMSVQFVGILLLAVGVYRFAALWVGDRAASYAALASVFLGSESFLVYSAGQLGTTIAAPLYLNSLPFVYDWLRYGRWRSLVKGFALLITAAAAHHVTLLFGSPFLALPVFVLALRDSRSSEVGAARTTLAGVVSRAVAISLLVGGSVAVVLLPYWIGLLHNPVTQTPIPHPSRANFILSPEWGLNYFIVPYGAMIIALPFIVWWGSAAPRLRPLLLSFWAAFLFGLGGTTPVAQILLGRAFYVLTFERFTYWASLLALPILGALIIMAIERFRFKAVTAVTALAAATCAIAVSWSTYKPADAANFNVEPVALWLNRDGHDKFRYLTLGFGNKLSRLAIETDANSVDGESNSSRSLPELTEFGGAALTSAKYFGKPGLDSLRAMLNHADHYGLKWVIVRDPYYDPLLYFAGWRQVDTLEDNGITVWSKDGVPPATPMNLDQVPSHVQGLIWGILPVGCSIFAIFALLLLRENSGQKERDLAEGGYEGYLSKGLFTE